MKKTGLTLAISALLAISSPTWAARHITDQLGRHITIPDHVNRVVVLQHQTLDILVELDAQKSIVGVLSSWERHLGAGFVRLYPQITKLPMPGDLTNVNIESILKLHPQVIFVTNYSPKTMLAQLERTGIPVVAISLRKYQPGQSNKLNPTIKNENQAYNEGLKNGILLIGKVVNHEAQAKALVHYIFKHRTIVAKRLKGLPADKRVRVYIANPNLTTYGSGKYTGLMLEHAGAMNVAASSIKGYKQVSLENVLQWDPQVIFVQHRFAYVVKKIEHNPAWQSIDAVKHHRIYLMPEYAKAWGYPMPEALSVGELWMAKKLYPNRFKDINVQKAANDFYERFYRTQYQPTIDTAK
ncbi:MAG: hypothetical protein CENE_01187 [Candidatus Celerinatantimonas neptuna]|nr:MAG: hypothetical protein CENE_01187 [Candidatus Celerinatantimonas neptuna]